MNLFRQQLGGHCIAGWMWVCPRMGCIGISPKFATRKLGKSCSTQWEFGCNGDIDFKQWKMRQLTNKDGIYLQKEIKTHTHIFYVDIMRLNVECNGIKLDIQPCDMM